MVVEIGKSIRIQDANARVRCENPRAHLNAEPQQFFGDLREAGKHATEEFFATVRIPSMELRRSLTK
jgi:hypothetical protein